MNFDIAMPLTLFFVTLAAIFFDKKVERKMKGVFEEKEFRVRDAILLVAAMAVTVSLIVFIPQMAIMTIFLFSYSMLLFTFTYIFSDFKKAQARLFNIVFLVVSFTAATISLYNLDANSLMGYGALAFFCLFAFTFIALLYDELRTSLRERWYLAILPPALFIFLYSFFSGTPIWFPYLLDIYGIVFAVLIILYLGSFFTWRTTLIFVTLLTAMDVILVLVTGAMVSAASHVSVLQLPMLIAIRTIPAVVRDGYVIWMSLGLGDFFFAGLIALQTVRKYGREYAILSAIAMSASFFIFEAFLLTYELRAFPGTVMIICGWIPLILWKKLGHEEKDSFSSRFKKE
ncbi:hypothetical protein HXY33_02155 [Candidatus Bathyarchaeota archaeon]|nr:hypothetical protein [Candidatus Bathyarchaeota archaeon]